MSLLLAFIGFALAVFFAALVWKLTRDERLRSEARVAALSDAIDDATLTTAVENAAVQPTFFTSERPSTSHGVLLKLAVGAGCVALIVVLAMLSTSTSPSERSPSAGISAPAAGSVKDGTLELLSMRHERQGDGLTVTGLVRNGGSAQADRLIAVVFTFDRNGNFLASGRAPLEFLSLKPGDESPFRVSIPGVGDVGRYRVSFRTEAGVVRHVDRRQALLARRAE